MTLEERFWSYVVKRDGCWGWTASKHPAGYGAIGDGSRVLSAHRLSWSITYGEIPDGMCVCHHCDNPECVNPEHLFLGTHANNMADMAVKGRHGSKTQPRPTSCPNGHEYSEQNSYLAVTGWRVCRVCKRRREREKYHRRRARAMA